MSGRVVRMVRMVVERLLSTLWRLVGWVAWVGWRFISGFIRWEVEWLLPLVSMLLLLLVLSLPLSPMGFDGDAPRAVLARQSVFVAVGACSLPVT